MATANDQVSARAIRPFEGEEGFKDENSPPFKVSRLRFGELKANGLVEEDRGVGSIKAAPAPENKMAHEPANKARLDASKGAKAV